MEDPANETIFAFPSGVNSYLFFVTALGGALVPFLTLAPSRSLMAPAIAAVVIGALLMDGRRRRYRVAVSDDGIRYIVNGVEPTFFRWDEIASLDLRERTPTPRLVISDAAGLRKISLDCRLENFGSLLSLVVARAKECDPHPSLPSTFHANYFYEAVLVLVSLIAFAMSLSFVRAAQPVQAGSFVLFAAIPIGMLAVVPRTLTVSMDSISVGYLGWQREIPIGSVTGIRFGIARGGRGSIWTVVWVDTADAKPLKLSGFTAGSLAVYYSLHDAWRTAKGRQ